MKVVCYSIDRKPIFEGDMVKGKVRNLLSDDDLDVEGEVVYYPFTCGYGVMPYGKNKGDSLPMINPRLNKINH